MFADFAEHQARYGDVSVFPTPAFFHGLADGEEITVDIAPGKTLVIRLLGRTETDDGHLKLFFELNGQPRLIKVPRLGLAVSTARQRAEDGNPDHIGAPMPGMVATVAVRPNQTVQQGETLLTLEAMKMEMAIKAERNGVIKQVHTKPGAVVEAHDLLVEWQPSSQN